MRIRTGQKAWKFKETIRKARERKIVKRCLEEKERKECQINCRGERENYLKKEWIESGRTTFDKRGRKGSDGEPEKKRLRNSGARAG